MSSLGPLLLEHAFDEIGDFSRGRGTVRTDGGRGGHGPLARYGDRKALGEHRAEKLHQHKRIKHTALFGEINLAEILIAEARRKVLGKRCFQPVSLGDLPAGAT